jgi:hypothetical protein
MEHGESELASRAIHATVIERWIKPVAAAVVVAIALSPLGVASIPRSERDVEPPFLRAAVFVLPFLATPLGLTALLIGGLLYLRRSWRRAAEWVVRFGTGLLATSLVALSAALLLAWTGS